ncbi:MULTISPECIES: OmpH family outer membrane protein [Hallella]|uniref:OmpH family outer membrane protein n=1 Tax=Hallella faecis TaxID=2841596 RepID=A0ABV1FTF1_9BACT|nr:MULTISPECIES: OmpH family outer membrane protein [Hallella]MBP6273553.1 OmpH family outer membrane protein [Prevotella sp.]MBS7400749.1 OmpH family outer membrane protein [Prevotella sp.]MBU0290852.1 OmpH family outer membrane protein [Hallella faecis]MCI7433604.1 OmpH family outer membrane protein [Prevotella sp.]MDD7144884.1 OmpH family outer membrane protein [Hallella sp.]
MKKNIILSVALAAATTMGLVSCDKSSPKMDDKTPASAQKSGECAKIAYVEVDSIMTQYKFCKEYSKILETKGNNIQKTLATKQQQLQAAAANFQQKIQQNAYTREQAEAIQAGLQKQNNDLQVLNQRLSAEFQTETDNFNKALHDSLQHYLAFYNKDKKYSLIFSKQGDNLLYADKAYDITNEVVAGLNKAYKGKATADKAKK